MSFSKKYLYRFVQVVVIFGISLLPVFPYRTIGREWVMDPLGAYERPYVQTQFGSFYDIIEHQRNGWDALLLAASAAVILSAGIGLTSAVKKRI